MTIDFDTTARVAIQETQAVRGGTERSQFDETNEAVFLNSGYVYKSAEEAESAFQTRD